MFGGVRRGRRRKPKFSRWLAHTRLMSVEFFYNINISISAGCSYLHLRRGRRRKPKCSRSLLLAHLERFDALVLEENEELRGLLANADGEA